MVLGDHRKRLASVLCAHEQSNKFHILATFITGINDIFANFHSFPFQLKMRAGVIDPSRNKKRRSPKVKQKRSSSGSMSASNSSSNIAAAQNTENAQQVVSEKPPSDAPVLQQAEPSEVAPNAEDVVAPSSEALADSLAETVIPIEDEPAETPADAVPTSAPSDTISPAEEEALEEAEVIATTPMSHGTTVIDIHESFQVEHLIHV